MTAKERLENDLASNESRIVITPQLNLIMKKEADRRRENLPTTNKIILLISKEDGQTPGRDLILTLKTDRPAADQNLYLQNIYFTHPLYIPLHYVFIFPWGDPGRYLTLHLRNGANPNRLREKMTAQIYYRFYLYILS